MGETEYKVCEKYPNFLCIVVQLGGLHKQGIPDVSR